MKSFKKSIAIVLALGVVLFGCQPDNVKPKDDSPMTLNAEENPHPLPDPVCSSLDTITFMSTTGSERVDYCGFRACPPTTQSWGQVQLLNGDEHMIMNFSMAVGWYINVSRSRLDFGENFTMDENSGWPELVGDWLANDVNPLRNKWQLVVPLVNLPQCYSMAFQLTVVRRSFFGSVDPNSTRTLWGYNANWNNPTHPRRSASPYLTKWCKGKCDCVGTMPQDAETECVTLHPNTTGLVAPFTYSWSSGETTETITVCPTAESDYLVEITDANYDVSTTMFRVTPSSDDDILCHPNGKKASVCHLPPGNPENPQQICINFSGVKAHVEAFRTPEDNPNLGHDSGCEIGPCNWDPCNWEN